MSFGASIRPAAGEGRALSSRVLVVEDDRALRETATEFLSAVGHEVRQAAAVDEALERLAEGPTDVVLADLILERGTGLELLRAMRRLGHDAEVIIMTGHGGVDVAVEAIREGAYDFVTKPVDLRRLELDVLKATEKRRLEESVRRLGGSEGEGFGPLVGRSAPMREAFALLERASRSDASVLICGPSGTGKSLAARALHELSPRREGPLVVVNCAALSPELVESELFGHERGAFTGAERARRGSLAAAAGGTLLLDEIGAASERLQGALLRALQERRVRPLGADGSTGVELDLRVVATTNVDLDEAIEAGRFRRDLYYRLATLVVSLPPLEERREDVPLLAGVLLARLAERTERAARLSPRALERIASHCWPGNVRELEHALERALLVGSGPVLRERDLALGGAEELERIPTLEELEREHVRRVLALVNGNKLQAARTLGIPRATLYRKIARYGLEPEGENGSAPPGAPPRKGAHPEH